MPGKLLVYLGGIRSGKSRLAEERFKKGLKGKPWRAAYLATVDLSLAKSDASFKARVAEHKKRRPAAWLTLECAKGLKLGPGCQAHLLDGLGLWVALNLGSKDILKSLQVFLKDLKAKSKLSVLVLDEVGQGGVSLAPAQRRFTDINGLANQAVCAAADKVWRVDAGIATRIK